MLALKKFFTGACLALLLATTLAPLIPAGTAHADTVGDSSITATWVDHATIKVTGAFNPSGITLVDTDIGPDDGTYRYQFTTDDCTSSLELATSTTGASHGSNGNTTYSITTGNLELRYPAGDEQTGTYCQLIYGDTQSHGPLGNTRSIALGHSEFANINYYFRDTAGTLIGRADGKADWQFEKCPATSTINNCANTWLRTSESACRDTLILNPAYAGFVQTMRTATNQDVANSGLIQEYSGDANNCEEAHDPLQVYMGNIIGEAVPDGTSLATNQNGSSVATLEIGCDTTINPLTWVICPIIDAANDMIKQLDNAITTRLNVDTCFFDDATVSSDATASQCDGTPDPSRPFFTVWSSFRTIAVALMVLIGLIMVFSQAVSIGPFDAYTIRKIMPRLVLAVIFMSTSWYILKFMVELSNDVGHATRAIIEGPFGGNVQVGSGASTGLGLFVGGALIGLGIFGLLSFAITAALAVVIGFVVLAIREILIQLLVVLSPLAIIAFILPNTQRIWKLWWDTFSRALMMFPIVMAFVAFGHAFAATADKNGDNSVLNELIIFVAYFGPYFALSFAFRLAGGAIAQISGIANDRGKGAFDRLKKYRGEQGAKNWAKTKGYSRFSENGKLGRIGKVANTALGVGTTSPRALARGRRGISAARETGRTITGQALAEGDKTYQANKNNDQFLLALANADIAKQYRKEARDKYDTAARTGNQVDMDKYGQQIAAWDQAIGAAQSIAQNPAINMAATQALAASGYQFRTGRAGYNQLAETVAKATGATLEYETDDSGNYITDRYGQRNVVGASGARAGDFANAMNSAQFGAKNAGRYDLGAINNGAGWDFVSSIDKASGYVAGNAKKNTWQGGAEEYLGSEFFQPGDLEKTLEQDDFNSLLETKVARGEIEQPKLEEYYGKLLDGYSGATGGNKKEIDKQMAAIRSLGDSRPGLKASFDKIEGQFRRAPRPEDREA